MSLQTVTINARVIEVYLDLDAVDAYADSGAGAGPDAWRALVDADPDDDPSNARKRFIVQGTRLFNALPWKGAPTTPAVDSTTLAWPRTGLVDSQGEELDDATVPQALLDGFCEMVMQFAVDNAAAAAAADQGSNIRSLQAGSASIEYFQATSVADGSASMLPPAVDRLVGRWLAGGAASEGGAIRGGSWKGERCGSYMDACEQYSRSDEF